MDDGAAAIVVDNGSHMIRTGWGGDDAPELVVPARVGRLRTNSSSSVDLPQMSYGDDAMPRSGVRGAMMKVSYPIRDGFIEDFDDMQGMWRHTFHQLLPAHLPDHPMFLTESPLNTNTNRAKMCEIMFESFEVPAFYVSSTSLLSLYSQGRTVGLVVDVGHTVTTAACVLNGSLVRDAIMRTHIGGHQVTDRLHKLLSDRGIDLSSPAERETLRDVKEQLCRVAPSEDAATTTVGLDSTPVYELPDGTPLTLTLAEVFGCAEALFQPSLIGLEGDGIADLAFRAATACSSDHRRELFQNVVLVGGGSLQSGLPNRFDRDLKHIVDASFVPTTVIAAPERKYSPWIGGSILASLSTFENLWVSKKEYDEHGLQRALVKLALV